MKEWETKKKDVEKGIFKQLSNSYRLRFEDDWLKKPFVAPNDGIFDAKQDPELMDINEDLASSENESAEEEDMLS